MIRSIFSAVVTGLLFLPLAGYTQIQKPDTAFVQEAIDYSRSLYFASTRAQSNFNNGVDFQEYLQRNDEFPYFLSDDWIMGSIEYDHDQYFDVPLLYDISQQKVITEHFSTQGKMALINKKIQSFTVSGHTFIWLDGNHGLPKSGFYDLIYDGPTRVVARREKQIQERVSANQLEAQFDEINKYFMLVNGNYFPVRNKKSVLRVLGNQKNAIRQFIKEKRIRFRENREDALLKIAEFYDSLKNKS